MIEVHQAIFIPSKFALCAKYSHIVDFLGSRRMETAPTSIEVLLRPTLGQSDEHLAVTGGHLSNKQGARLFNLEPTPMSERRIPYIIHWLPSTTPHTRDA